MERKISVAIPHYNNTKFIKDSLKVPIEDERIDEIIIVDDASKDLEKLKNIIKELNSNKIKLFENKKNLGCYHNKILSVSKCTNDWCILLDSDNYFDKSYIDKIYQIGKWDKKLIYAPYWAKSFPRDPSPSLNYTKFINKIIDKKFYIDNFNCINFQCLINTCNYFFPKNEFLDSIKQEYDREKIDCLDSALLFTDWLFNKNKVKIVEGMFYNHRLHPNSNYMQGRSRKYENIIKRELYIKIKKSL